MVSAWMLILNFLSQWAFFPLMSLAMILMCSSKHDDGNYEKHKENSKHPVRSEKNADHSPNGQQSTSQQTPQKQPTPTSSHSPPKPQKKNSDEEKHEKLAEKRHEDEHKECDKKQTPKSPVVPSKMASGPMASLPKASVASRTDQLKFSNREMGPDSNWGKLEKKQISPGQRVEETQVYTESTQPLQSGRE